jgi:hypothetical protein
MSNSDQSPRPPRLARSMQGRPTKEKATRTVVRSISDFVRDRRGGWL